MKRSLTVVLPFPRRMHISDAGLEILRKQIPEDVRILLIYEPGMKPEPFAPGLPNVSCLESLYDGEIRNAVRSGVEYADSEYVIVMPEEHNVPPGMIDSMLKKADAVRADVVCASRYMKGGTGRGGFGESLKRMAGVLFFAGGFPTHDPGGPFQLYRRSFLLKTGISAVPGMESVVRAWQSGGWISEIPVVWKGRSPVCRTTFLKSLCSVVRTQLLKKVRFRELTGIRQNSSRRELSEYILHGLFILLLLLSIYVFCINPGVISCWEQHEFRKAQTAISTFYFSGLSDLLYYETPVLGYPWRIPFEFPLYQALAALLAKTGLELERALSAVAGLFFLGTLIPLHFICRFFTRDRMLFFTISSLYLALPFTLYWGICSPMIESCAVFFAVLFVAGMLCFLRKPSAGALCTGVFGAVLGGMVKITTLPMYAVFTGIVWLAYLLNGRISWKRFLVPGIAGLVALVPVFWWTAHADRLKSCNPLAMDLVSSRMNNWNFGPVQMRFDPVVYRKFYHFLVRDVFGDELAVVCAAVILGIGLVVFRKRGAWTVGAALFSWGLGFLIFTNLYYVHNYYQMANILLLLSALGGVCFLFIRKNFGATVLFAVGILFFQFIFYNRVLPRMIANAERETRVYAPVWEAVQKYTPPDSAIVVLGYSWSSYEHFRCRRRGIAVSRLIPQDLKRLEQSWPEVLGGRPLSAVIILGWQTGETIRSQIGPLEELLFGSRRIKRTFRSGELTLYLFDLDGTSVSP